ncbi:MAG: hypothetical protein MI867_03565 [Pseudomonadales bacterium]|nr:hypothetical protein [Pseudomonadales bacterium]
MSGDFSQVQENLARMLEVALETTLTESSHQGECNFRREQAVNEFEMEHCIVLTISSFRFRVMVILHLSFDDRMRQFIADLTDTKKQETDDEKLLDWLLEMSNSFCGHVKRHLQDTCPPLGMSTPNFLDSACLSLDGVVEVAHQAHVKMTDAYGGEPLFGASVLVSLLDDADFKINAPQAVSQEGGGFESFGELEMF